MQHRVSEALRCYGHELFEKQRDSEDKLYIPETIENDRRNVSFYEVIVKALIN